MNRGLSLRNLSQSPGSGWPGRATPGAVLLILSVVISVTASGCAPDPVVQPSDWVEADGYRYRELAVQGGRPGFREVPQSGIDFVNVLSDGAIVKNRNRMNGSGVATGDVDGDGLPDVFFAAMESRPRLYRNLGDWTFEDATTDAGLESAPNWSTGATLADVDGDADLDLFVTVLTGRNRLYLNDGVGRFSETRDAGLNSHRGSMGAAFADTDGDGDLDLYVANYKRIAARDSLSPDRLLFDQLVQRDGTVVPEMRDHFRIEKKDGRQVRLELGEEDEYYLNRGDGTFAAAPIPGVSRDWGLTVRMQDFSGDGVPDLYVANDFESPDYVFLGDGKGGWIEGGVRMGHTPNSSMAVGISDVNRDGHADIFVPDMLSPDPMRSRWESGTAAPFPVNAGDLDAVPQYMQNGLFLGRSEAADGRLRFADAAWAYRVAATEWSWSSTFLDVDLDGWDDLLVTTGHSFDVQDVDAQMREREAIRRVRSIEEFRSLITQYPRLELPNVALRNVDGARFEWVPGAWGLGKEDDITTGLAVADFDGDGDLDIVTNRLNGPAGLFRNESDAPRVAVRIRSSGDNPFGVGVRIGLEEYGRGEYVVHDAGPGPPRAPSAEIVSGGGYLSGSEPLVSLAATSDDLWLRVGTGGGAIPNVQPNRLYEITDLDAVLAFKHFEPPSASVFVAARPVYAQESMPWTHQEAPFDDRERQPLLTRSLASVGPVVITGDLNGDGADDLVLGAGSGGTPALYLSSDVWSDAWSDASLDGESPGSGSGLGTVDGDWTGGVIADGRLVVAVSGYEAGVPGTLRVYELRAPDQTLLNEISRLELPFSATGAVAAADTDLDGDQEFFVAARVADQGYPEAAASLIVLLQDEALIAGPSLATGLVTGADFGDIDGDGDPDLAIASEWGPVRVWENRDGDFEEVTSDWGLEEQSGLWQGVHFADLDADGRPDLVGLNWGWNSRLGRIGAPDGSGVALRLYHGDFNGDGRPDPVEAEYRQDLDAWSPIADFSTLRIAIPILGRRVSSFHAFAASSVEDLFGDDLQYHETRTLASTAFMNVGGRFEAELLPLAAQLSPANTAVSRTHDGPASGPEVPSTPTIYLAQNFFPVLPERTARQDAGGGLTLRRIDGQWESHDLGVFGDQRGIGLWREHIILGINASEAILVTPTW